MQCPNCKSEDAIKLSLVHAAGLSNVQTRSRGHAWALGDAGLLLGFGGSKATGTSQTQLSKLAAPPRKRRYRRVILAWILGPVMGSSFILDYTASSGGTDARILNQIHVFVYALSALLVLIIATLWTFNHTVFPRRHEIWIRSFMCRRCGEIFQLPAGQ